MNVLFAFALDKATDNKWTARIYLSVKGSKRLPMSNISSMISEFKRAIKVLHVTIPVKETLDNNQEHTI